MASSSPAIGASMRALNQAVVGLLQEYPFAQGDDVDALLCGGADGRDIDGVEEPHAIARIHEHDGEATADARIDAKDFHGASLRFHLADCGGVFECLEAHFEAQAG